MDWEREPLRDQTEGSLHGIARHPNSDDDIRVALRTADQEAPGLAGVTVVCAGGTELSLQRGQGGLDASERMLDGTEHSWKIMGASRGEGGILGEGVRQALLRDPTYLPALDAARGDAGDEIGEAAWTCRARPCGSGTSAAWRPTTSDPTTG